MNSSQESLNLIDDVIAELSALVTADERASGWEDESKQATVKYFTEIRECLITGTPLPSLDIVRGLDHWGVSDGNLLKKIARIANHLRNQST
jgi:hypothetical protein